MAGQDNDRQRRAVETRIRSYAASLGLSDDDPRLIEALTTGDSSILNRPDPKAVAAQSQVAEPVVTSPPSAPPAPAPPANGTTVRTSTPPVKPIVSAVEAEEPQSTYRSVGVLIYADHEKAMDAMTQFCREHRMRVRKGSNTTLFVGAALEHLAYLFQNDPTKFKEIVNHRIESLTKETQ